MFDFSEVLAWIAIGAGAGIVGNLWHDRRDPAGVVGKLVVGAAGAVVGGALAALLLPDGRASTRLIGAAFFAFLALAVLHVSWMIARKRGASSAADLDVDPPGNKILSEPTSPGSGPRTAPAHPSRASK